MPKYFIYLIYTAIFATILIATVPKQEIRRLSIYGIIFGGMMDVVALIGGKITGLYGWINYGPFAFMGIPIFSSLSWAIYYIMYFYFLPPQKPLTYIYAAAGIVFSILYTNLIIDLGVFQSPYSRFFLPLFVFIIWYSIATWGYYRLTAYFQEQQQAQQKAPRYKLVPPPARKIAMPGQQKVKLKKLGKKSPGSSKPHAD